MMLKSFSNILDLAYMENFPKNQYFLPAVSFVESFAYVLNELHPSEHRKEICLVNREYVFVQMLNCVLTHFRLILFFPQETENLSFSHVFRVYRNGTVGIYYFFINYFYESTLNKVHNITT